MHHNGREPLSASRLSAGMLDLREGEEPMMACPDCGGWRLIKDSRGGLLGHRTGVLGFLQPHHVPDTRRRCPGAGQRIFLDLTAAQFALHRRDAVTDAARRRGTRVVPRPKPADPAPLTRLAAREPIAVAARDAGAAITLARLERILA